MIPKKPVPHLMRDGNRFRKRSCSTSNLERVPTSRSRWSRITQATRSVTARLPHTRKAEETMNIDRRQLALPALAIGLLGVVPVFAASADEDAVRLEEGRVGEE